ncbi:MAG: hypothetical protein K0S04_299 [Herbinix sp.]|jgi:predicted RNA-binding protein with EMAP domain|nr:hypothetical protein [Herbinix sp.]
MQQVKLLANMTLDELNKEIESLQNVLNRICKRIEALNGEKDYSDEISKYFHLGKVGFRKDTKKQNRTVDRAVNRGVEATKLYELRNSTENRIKNLKSAVTCIENNDITLTKSEIISKKIDEFKDLEWTRENGGYRSGEWFVKKVDDVAFAYKNGKMLFYKKTLKEVKKLVAIAANKVK